MPIRNAINAANNARTIAAAQAGAQAGASASGAGVISVDHAQVMIEVNRLRSVASELNTLHTNAQAALRNMNGFWEGAAANEFAVANERWRAEIRAIENEITELATLIQRIADEIRDAERRTKAAIKGF